MCFLSRQEVAFLKDVQKIKGCGILKRDFYTRFIPNFSGFGAVTWLVVRSVVLRNIAFCSIII